MGNEKVFRTDVMHLDGSVLVALVGDLDLVGAMALEAELRPIGSRYDADQVVVDCTRLTFIDAFGLGHLVRFAKGFGPGGGRPKLRGAPPMMRRIMKFTRTDELFELADAAENPATGRSAPSPA